MKNPLFDRRHIKEYILYGLIAAVVYMFFVWVIIKGNMYENFYLLYIGSFGFMCTIFLYVIRLLHRTYHNERAASTLIAGHLASLAGVVFSCIFTVVLILCYHPAI